MLQCKDMYFKFNGGGWLLENFNISLNPGESVGLQGKSGSGKTTLARILTGYIKPIKGVVQFDEGMLPDNCFSPVQLVYQHPELSINPRWKVKKILGEVKGHEPDGELLDKLAISNSWLERYPHELSGGELQRICVARILNPRVRYLICDEISGMLDAITQAQVWNTVIDFSKTHNVGLLIISHDSNLLGRLCSRELSI
jgi:peptide/nickel transport system ATP-binding protein